MNKKILLHYATLTVPRYTSYPTAIDFSILNDETRALWLQEIKHDQTVSLYLHIPFCKEICHYCACFTKAVRNENTVKSYAKSLCQEISLQSSFFKKKPHVVHLHWGGGTPSILSRQSFEKLITILSKTFIFETKMEHAIELDPRFVNEDFAFFLSDLGITRVSLGVQDINHKVQELIGRRQPLKIVQNAIKSLHKAGIHSINIDLIYGLPQQTCQSLQDTCKVIASFYPDRIACFGYAHLPKRRANQRLINSALLPDSWDRLQQANIVWESFCSFGYEAIGIDHFARFDDPLTIAKKKRDCDVIFRDIQMIEEMF